MPYSTPQTAEIARLNEEMSQLVLELDVTHASNVDALAQVRTLQQTIEELTSQRAELTGMLQQTTTAFDDQLSRNLHLR